MDKHIEFISRQAIDKETWNSFVNGSDEAWLWHRFETQDALATWPGKYDVSFAVLDTSSGGDIVALVPLHLLESRVSFISMNILDSLGGPALKNDLGERYRRNILKNVREHLLFLAQKYKTREINLALSPMAPAYRGEHCPRVNPLLDLGCENTLTQTWVVDLRAGKDSVWQGMEGRARTAIRKAEKSEISVRLADRLTDCDLYYQLHCETYKRTGVQPHNKAYFEAIWRDFFATDLARILFAESEGRVVAADNLGIYKKAAIYWTGAANSEGLSTEANSLVQWAAMQWMLETGMEWYETGEAFPHIDHGKLKGLNDFKKSFGGKLYPFYRGQIVVKPVLKVGRDIIKSIWS